VTVDAFLIPLKAFDRAKERLRADTSLDVTTLAREWATEVVLACAPVPVIVVTESPEVATFARDLGADVALGTSVGLNEALGRAYADLASRLTVVAIAPGDLRLPQGLGLFDPDPGVTVISDRHGTGTNVLALPTGLGFQFAYGTESARRHLDEGRRLGLAVHLVSSGPWCHDIDRPEDLT
jgi:2-phospho-L-lactate/phosphoenolpyruvate guanylyltransferase